MTREDVKKIFGENITDDQITKFLNSYQGEATRAKTLETALNAEKEKNKELEGYKEEVDKIKKEKMSDQEKIQAMKEEAEKNLSESRKTLNNAKAKEILNGLNIDDSLLSSIVNDDTEKTIANATALRDRMASYKEEVTKEVTEKLLNKKIDPPTSNKTPSNSKGMTLEQYNALSDDEKIKFADEHPTEFENL